MEFHPASEAFPEMPPDRFAELKADIGAHGLLEPITLCDGLILDGRNRYRACVELGVEPQTREYSGNPWAYVWSLNGQRRDLSQDQRAQIWIFVNARSEEWEGVKRGISDEANRKRSEAAKAQPRAETGVFQPVVVQNGQAPATQKPQAKTRQAAASAANVKPSAIARAEALASARPDLAAQVRTGAIKPAEARRQVLRDRTADKVACLPPGQFVVIYADPPWSYNDKLSGDLENYRAAEKHYPSMSLSELKALSVPAAPDSVLFLWATSPMFVEALELAKTWGFHYRASFIWDKVRHNFGHYNSVRHEFLLVCVRGSCTPQNVKLFDSVQSIERTGHSEKPEEFREIIQIASIH